MIPLHTTSPQEIIRALLTVGATFRLSGRELKRLRRQMEHQLRASAQP